MSTTFADEAAALRDKADELERKYFPAPPATERTRFKVQTERARQTAANRAAAEADRARRMREAAQGYDTMDDLVEDFLTRHRQMGDTAATTAERVDDLEDVIKRIEADLGDLGGLVGDSLAGQLREMLRTTPGTPPPEDVWTDLHGNRIRGSTSPWTDAVAGFAARSAGRGTPVQQTVTVDEDGNVTSVTLKMRRP